ncbi:MAG: hypothetical protein V4627_02865 [Pseudomonadota bacterium]
MAKQEKLAKLIDLMQIDQSLEIARRSCVDASMAGPHSPDKIWAREGKFSGLSPKSTQWPEAINAFRRYSEKTCMTESIAAWKQSFVNFYGARLDEADLDSVIKYMSSPAAKALTKLQGEFQIATSNAYAQKGIQQADMARQEYWDEIAELTRREAAHAPSQWWRFWK